MKKRISNEKNEQQRTAYAVKACYMMGFSHEKCAKALNMEIREVELMYWMISEDLIDFESGTF